MAYSIDDPKFGITTPLTQVGTDQLWPLGTQIKASDDSGTLGEGTFIYLKGVANTTVGALVNYNNYAKTTTLATTAAYAPCAVAMGTAGSGYYGWYQVVGVAAVLTSTGAAGSAMNVSANAGTVTTTAGSTGRALVSGAICLTAADTPAAGQSYFAINWPTASGLDGIHP